MIDIDETAQRISITSDGATGFIQYRVRPERFIITHTIVPDEMSGQGVGGRLVTAAVDYAAERRMIVVPLCPFARSWLRRHPDTAAQVTVEWPGDET